MPVCVEKRIFAAAEEALVRMHAGAVDAEIRFGHEGHREIMPRGNGADDIF